MGKRKKSTKPQGPRKREPLPTTFPCLFCNHEKSVTVKLEKKAGVGQLSCKVCGQSFQTGINYLSAAVDVYSDWIDACDMVAKDAAGVPDVTSRNRVSADADADFGLDDSGPRQADTRPAQYGDIEDDQDLDD